MQVETVSLSDWDGLLPDSGFGPFHRTESLRTIREHVDGDLRLFCGFKGDQPVALLPVVVSSHVGVSRLTASPPPGMSIPYLGPVLMPTSPKPRKQEKINRRFAEGVLERLGDEGPFDLLRFSCLPDFDDPRPYEWSGLDVETKFTYHVNVDCSDVEEVQRSFSRSLRREARKEQTDLGVTIEDEGVEGARTIYRDLQSRYEEQEMVLPVDEPFVLDFVEALGENCAAYVAREDGEFRSGIVVPYSNDMALFWLGGARASVDNVSVNTLLHSHIIEDALTNPDRKSVRRYDLAGANTERLCRYKSKFGGQLVPFYTVSTSTVSMDIARRAYKLLRR